MAQNLEALGIAEGFDILKGDPEWRSGWSVHYVDKLQLGGRVSRRHAVDIPETTSSLNSRLKLYFNNRRAAVEVYGPSM
jgi:hypothetical protein